MSSTTLAIVLAIAIIVAGILAGIFFSFSDFIMKALADASPASGLTAMQEINRRVYGSVFLVLLLGFAVFSITAAIYVYFQLPAPVSTWIIAGSLTYLLGVMLVTIVFNVPMNDKLDQFPETDPNAALYWQQYLSTWTNWNHVRTLASVACTGLFLIAFHAVGRTTQIAPL